MDVELPWSDVRFAVSFETQEETRDTEDDCPAEEIEPVRFAVFA